MKPIKVEVNELGCIRLYCGKPGNIIYGEWSSYTGIAQLLVGAQMYYAVTAYFAGILPPYTAFTIQPVES